MKPPIEFKVMKIRECQTPPELVDNPQRATDYWRRNIQTAPWYDEAKEALVVLILNTRRRIIGHNLVSLGGLDTCFVHPREVFRPVIVAAGASIIMIHNHPSGDSTPSDADVKVTREIIRAGQLLKIEVLDHIIVGREHHSLKTLGYFYQ